MRIKLITFFIGISFFNFKAQNVHMYFPYFVGKAYDFMIFQGNEVKTVQQGVIPPGGSFILNIPDEYSSYVGMSRWLITGTKDGGGLEMVIPGKKFSVSCEKSLPTNDNIFYRENDEINRLNGLHKKQQKILNQYNAMSQVINSFDKTDVNYKIYEKEYKSLTLKFDDFQKELAVDRSFSARFLQIDNVRQGIGSKLLDNEDERARNVARFITDDIDFKFLYTSGHWSEVISIWVNIYAQVLKDQYLFVNDFAKIGEKISDPIVFTDFTSVVSKILTQQGKDNYLYAIAPLVSNSGKIKKYEGILSVFEKAAIGTQAPDLMINQNIGSIEDNKLLKSSNLAEGIFNRTLIIFYESGCGPCANLLQQMPGNFETLKSKGVRIISISADTDKHSFEEKAKGFMWKDSFCDYNGLNGINFKNYAVAGTPTMFLLDKDGKIILRTASLEELLQFLK